MRTNGRIEGNFSPGAVTEYLVEAGWRTILFRDVLRRRGNQYLEHMAKTVPHVLQFDLELITDGSILPDHVNYCLVRIVPPTHTSIDNRKRPFTIANPQAVTVAGLGALKRTAKLTLPYWRDIRAISSALIRTPNRDRL